LAVAIRYMAVNEIPHSQMHPSLTLVVFNEIHGPADKVYTSWRARQRLRAKFRFSLPLPSQDFSPFLLVNICTLAHHLEVCASVNALLWAGRKGPATYTQYFALGLELSPALQSPFSFHLGCGYLCSKKKKSEGWGSLRLAPISKILWFTSKLQKHTMYTLVKFHCSC